MRKLILLSMLLGCVIGCNAAQKAQFSLERGSKIHMDVRTAFFVKSWTLNRALITEARHKWIGEAANAILEKSQENNTLTRQEAIEILGKLNQDIGQDEAVVSESFAYLAYLLIAGERADQYLSQVDGYLESQKPIWKLLSRGGKETVEDVLDELDAWKPLIRDIRKVIPRSIINNNK